MPQQQGEHYMDSVTRESHTKMIRHLTRRYSLQILVDQATFGKCSIDQLDDDELAALHHNLHKARECHDEGISLEEAGLIHEPLHDQGEMM